VRERHRSAIPNHISRGFLRMQLLPPGLYKKHKDLGTSKVETGIMQNRIQGGRGWVKLMVCRLAPRGGCTAGLYVIELLPGAGHLSLDSALSRLEWNLPWRRFKM